MQKHKFTAASESQSSVGPILSNRMREQGSDSSTLTHITLYCVYLTGLGHNLVEAKFQVHDLDACSALKLISEAFQNEIKSMVNSMINSILSDSLFSCSKKVQILIPTTTILLH